MTKFAEVRRSMVNPEEPLGRRMLKNVVALIISQGINSEEKAFELAPVVDGVEMPWHQPLAIKTESELDALLANDQVNHPPRPQLRIMK